MELFAAPLLLAVIALPISAKNVDQRALDSAAFIGSYSAKLMSFGYATVDGEKRGVMIYPQGSLDYVYDALGKMLEKNGARLVSTEDLKAAGRGILQDDPESAEIGKGLEAGTQAPEVPQGEAGGPPPGFPAAQWAKLTAQQKSAIQQQMGNAMSARAAMVAGSSGAISRHKAAMKGAREGRRVKDDTVYLDGEEPRDNEQYAKAAQIAFLGHLAPTFGAATDGSDAPGVEKWNDYEDSFDDGTEGDLAEILKKADAKQVIVSRLDMRPGGTITLKNASPDYWVKARLLVRAYNLKGKKLGQWIFMGESSKVPAKGLKTADILPLVNEARENLFTKR